MANAPEGMTILTVLPHNYDEILRLSQGTQKPYTREDLDRIRSQAQANNSVAMVMFMDPSYWKEGARWIGSSGSRD